VQYLPALPITAIDFGDGGGERVSSVTYAKLGITTYKMHWTLAGRVGAFVDKSKDEASAQPPLLLTFSIWSKRMTRDG